jgi:hypothetical protein
MNLREKTARKFDKCDDCTRDLEGCDGIHVSTENRKDDDERRKKKRSAGNQAAEFLYAVPILHT